MIVAGIAAFEIVSRRVADTLLLVESNILLILLLGFPHFPLLSVYALLVVLLFPPLDYVPDKDFFVEIGEEGVYYDDAQQDHFELVSQWFKL